MILKLRDEVSSRVQTGDSLILDSAGGLLIVQPEQKSLDYYRKYQEEFQQEREELPNSGGSKPKPQMGTEWSCVPTSVPSAISKPLCVMVPRVWVCSARSFYT